MAYPQDIINPDYEPVENLEEELSSEKLLEGFSIKKYKYRGEDISVADVKSDYSSDYETVYRKMKTAIRKEEEIDKLYYDRTVGLKKLDHMIEKLERDPELANMEGTYEIEEPNEEALEPDVFQQCARDMLYKYDMNVKFERLQELKEQREVYKEETEAQLAEADAKIEERLHNEFSEYCEDRDQDLDLKLKEDGLLEGYTPAVTDVPEVFDLEDIMHDDTIDYDEGVKRIIKSIENEALPLALRAEQDDRIRQLNYEISKLENDPQVSRMIRPYEIEEPDPEKMNAEEYDKALLKRLDQMDANKKYERLQILRDELSDYADMVQEERREIKEDVDLRIDVAKEIFHELFYDREKEKYEAELQAEKAEREQVKARAEQEKRDQEAAKIRAQEEREAEERELKENLERQQAKEEEERQERERNRKAYEQRMREKEDESFRRFSEWVQEQRKIEYQHRHAEKELARRDNERNANQVEAVAEMFEAEDEKIRHREETYRKYVNMIAKGLKIPKEEEAGEKKEAVSEGFTLADLLGDEEVEVNEIMSVKPDVKEGIMDDRKVFQDRDQIYEKATGNIPKQKDVENIEDLSDAEKKEYNEAFGIYEQEAFEEYLIDEGAIQANEQKAVKKAEDLQDQNPGAGQKPEEEKKEEKKPEEKKAEEEKKQPQQEEKRPEEEKKPEDNKKSEDEKDIIPIVERPEVIIDPKVEGPEVIINPIQSNASVAPRQEGMSEAERHALGGKFDDILDALTGTKNGYLWHRNSTEYDNLVNAIRDASVKAYNGTRATDMTNEKQAIVDYLNHVSKDTAWHGNGNVRKENALKALNLIDPEAAKNYVTEANRVRKEKNHINLDQLMEKEYGKKERHERRNADPQAENPANRIQRGKS
ncbi:MAG: hypothetical protein IKH46_14325 [Lachnospiraceae bacterium]|nr:hypothetical protein [Lachnospiraceae bacterium]